MRPAVNFADRPPATADLVVIGGGIIGCATAFFAARAGLDVVVLERRAALGTLTTPASTGAFRLQFDNPEEIALVREGVELFDAFE
jgi:glycine/D-amino acid oxidase-like deaminating enzyme